MIKVYHGDDFGSVLLDPKLMMHGGNNQEGVGIYFGPISMAEGYGKYISYANVDQRRFIDPRELVEDVIPHDKLIKLLLALHKSDEESMYYLVTDYGFDVGDVEDVDENAIIGMSDHIKTTEIRNLQIELAQRFDVKSLVKAWNEEIEDIDGTYHSETDIYCIINTDIKVVPVNFSMNSDNVVGDRDE